MKCVYVLILVCWGILCGSATEHPLVREAVPASSLLSGKWDANWISCPDVSLYEYGVYHFRKTFHIVHKPDSFIINVSADNRYRLFVNGMPVCYGPARGDLNHWYFETIDIASLLRAGGNTLAAVVWNAGPYTPGAQMTLKTGLIVQGNTAGESVVNTDSSWKVYRNPAYAPSLEGRQDVGCADVVQASLYPWGWETETFDDKAWKEAILLGRGQSYGSGTGYDWVLCRRDIPLMEDTLLRMQTIRRSEGITVSSAFLEGNAPLVIPANRKATLLIDQSYLTNAYPELNVSGGKGSEIRMRYSEALYKNGEKGNRNEIEGREVGGFTDKFYPDGGSNRLFRPLWFRTYRYVQLEIETKGEPLTLLDLYGMYTAYPFRENGSFSSNLPELQPIWEVGWRTARLCANETYYDCPYYEQLQYVGDTRIQALISLYVDGDDRLMRKAIKMFDYSRSYEGITTSRYPSRIPQYIPPFSLYWINMVHDYWMYRDDPVFVKSCMPGIKSVLEWFADKIDPKTGLLGAVPHWNFIDWPKQWPWDNNQPLGGTHKAAIRGGSAILSLQLAYTLKDAVELLNAFGETDLASRYEMVCRSLCRHTWNTCWDEEKQLLADDLEGTSYSQHANIMGILSDAVPHEKQQALFDKLDTDPTLIQATFYYRFYLFRALKKVGLADRYVEMLKPWQDMLAMGLTTFAENPEPTRSDCHAWSASPVYDFLATVCGVEPAEPGFRSVRIAPHIGSLDRVEGKIPHPAGLIEVCLKKDGERLAGHVVLPASLSGTFVWGGQQLDLVGGRNEIPPLFSDILREKPEKDKKAVCLQNQKSER